MLYDVDLRPIAEARREKALAYPRPGWVEQDPGEVLSAVTEVIAEVVRDADGDVVP